MTAALEQTTSKPIIFSGPMVQALLNGTKTQIRRVVKPQPLLNCTGFVHWTIDEERQFKNKTPLWIACLRSGMGKEYGCPYGDVGDLLWVREGWRLTGWDWNDPWVRITYGDNTSESKALPDEDWHEHWLEVQVAKIIQLPCVKFDNEIYTWDDDMLIPQRSPIYMPKWASRITLEVTDIRVEQLQDISEADAIAEGTQEFFVGLTNLKHGRAMDVACRHAIGAGEKEVAGIRYQFAAIWDLINGKKHPWSSNPWTWVIELRKVQP